MKGISSFVLLGAVLLPQPLLWQEASGPRRPPSIDCVLTASPAFAKRGDVVTVELNYYPCYDRGARTELITTHWPSIDDGYAITSQVVKDFPTPQGCVSSSMERILVPTQDTTMGLVTIDMTVKGVCTTTTTITVQ